VNSVLKLFGPRKTRRKAISGKPAGPPTGPCATGVFCGISVLPHIIIYDTTVIPRADDFCRPEESAFASPKSRFLARARNDTVNTLGMTESGRKCKELNGTVHYAGMQNVSIS